MSKNRQLSLAKSVNQITTVIGGTKAPFKEAGPASQAILEGPSGVAVDSKGNLYIAAFLAKRVFKIDPKGTLTVVAGTGEAATSGDGGPAAQAAINGPSAVAVDGGKLYITEQLGDRVRCVDESGQISTFAGTGRSRVIGNGLSEEIKDKVEARTGVIEQPAGIVVRDGEVYFTEFAGNRVRKVDKSGVMHIIAGTGERTSNGDGDLATKAALQGPTGITFDAKGNLYVSEVFSARIRRIGTDGKITTIAGLGKPGQFAEGQRARSANLRWPHGIVVDAKGSIYVADFANSRIYVISGGLIHTFAGIGEGGTVKTGSADAVPVENPLGLAFDAKGNLLVTLFNQGAVLEINTQGKLKHLAGQFVREADRAIHPNDAFLKGVSSVASDNKGNIYVTEPFGNSAHKVNADAEMTLMAGIGMATSKGDNRQAQDSTLNHPAGVLPMFDGLLIAEADGHRIRYVDSTGVIKTVVGTGKAGFAGDGGAALGAAVAHPHGLLDFGAEVSDPPPFLSGVAVTAKAAKNTKAAKARPFLAIVDTDNHRVRVVDENGTIQTLAGNGKPVSSGDGGPAKKAGLNRPEYLARDSEGNIYVSEAHKVRKIDKNGIISTYAGTGKRGFSGEGGPATKANLDSPYGLAMDGHDLYIADSWNNIIWKVDAKGIITRFAGNGKKASEGDGGSAKDASLNAPVELAVDQRPDGVYLLIGELEGSRVRAVKIR